MTVRHILGTSLCLVLELQPCTTLHHAASLGTGVHRPLNIFLWPQGCSRRAHDVLTTFGSAVRPVPRPRRSENLGIRWMRISCASAHGGASKRSRPVQCVQSVVFPKATHPLAEEYPLGPRPHRSWDLYQSEEPTDLQIPWALCKSRWSFRFVFAGPKSDAG